MLNKINHFLLDEETISALDFGKKLTDFQIVKLSYMFHALFDLDKVPKHPNKIKITKFNVVEFSKNDLIEKNDIDALVNKILAYTEWEESDPRYQSIVDIHSVFYECLQDQVRAEKGTKI